MANSDAELSIYICELVCAFAQRHSERQCSFHYKFKPNRVPEYILQDCFCTPPNNTTTLQTNVERMQWRL